MNNITTETLFKTAIALEKTSETIYRYFSKIFEHEKEVALFWNRYANEERGHALYLERILSEVENNRKKEPASEVIMSHLQSSIKRTSKIKLETIKTLDDAYNLATELETTETNLIFEFILTNFSIDELAKSRRFMRGQLKTHIHKLNTHFPQEFMNLATRERCEAHHDINLNFQDTLSNLFSFQSRFSFDDN